LEVGNGAVEISVEVLIGPEAVLVPVERMLDEEIRVLDRTEEYVVPVCVDNTLVTDELTLPVPVG
jgi:hypothetical protein